MPEGGNSPPEDRLANADSDMRLLDVLNAKLARLIVLHDEIAGIRLALLANAAERDA